MNDANRDNAAIPDDSNLRGYAESMTELESILADLERDDVDVDTLTARVQRASVLIAHCEGRLRATELSLQTILNQPDAPTSTLQGS